MVNKKKTTNSVTAALENTVAGKDVPKRITVRLKDQLKQAGVYSLFLSIGTIIFNDGKAEVTEKTAALLKEMGEI